MGVQDLGNQCSRALNQLQKNFAQMQVAFWMDPTFNAQLKLNPKQTMIQNGLDVSDNVGVELFINTDKVSYFVIPEKPKNLGDFSMELVLRSGTFGTGGSLACAGSFCGCLGTFGTVGTFGCA